MPKRCQIALGLTLATLSLLAACGDDDGGDETVTVTESPPVETSAGETTETGGTTGAEAPPGDQGPRQFQTPSGNIGCYMDATGARCDIAERDWEPPPPDEPCELDYGQGISVDEDSAGFVCAGDTTLGGPATLPYGSAARRGDFECVSEESGVTCTDTGDGRGFVISRQRYEIF